MRTILTGLAAAVVLGLACSGARAGWFTGPPPAPWACNSPFLAGSPNGYPPLPIYCFRGPCLPPPFNGFLPVPQPQGGPGGAGGFPLQIASFPMHPFAHGPRDYFMYGQQTND